MDRFFFHFVTMHEFDRQTDRILIARPGLHSMQRGKNGVHCTRISWLLTKKMSPLLKGLKYNLSLL